MQSGLLNDRMENALFFPILRKTQVENKDTSNPVAVFY